MIMNMNKVIIRNVNLLLNCEDFVKNFVNMIMLLLLDFYADYNQIKLNKVSRNMIAFQTSLELLRIIIIFIRVMNSVR